MGFEFQMLDGLQTIHTSFLDTFMTSITKLGDAGIVWIILTVILLLIPKTRKAGGYMAVALIADLIICNVILKPIVARPRPYSINKTVQLLVTPLKDYSFPSGHTATAFAGAEFLWQEYKDVNIWYGISGYAVAAGTGFFRIYNGRHWLSDVAMGAGIGILSTKAAYWMYPYLKKHLFSKERNTTSMIAPFYNGKQTGVGFVMQF